MWLTKSVPVPRLALFSMAADGFLFAKALEGSTLALVVLGVMNVAISLWLARIRRDGPVTDGL